MLEQWTGLGYYNRARNLHRLAQGVVRDHGGRLPTDTASLRGLPGIGPYTAGAVASIAFGMPVSLVDGNVARVLARWSGLRLDPTTGAGKIAVWQMADAELAEHGPAHAAPGHWNQALMELGATVCAPRTPTCGDCPVAARCLARRQGVQREIPPTRSRPAVIAIQAWYVVVSDANGLVLLARRPDRGRWAGLWEPPGAEGPDARDVIARWADRQGVVLDSALHPVVHVLTHRRYQATPLPARLGPLAIEVASLGYTAARWQTPDEAVAQAGGLSRLGQRLVAAVADRQARRQAAKAAAPHLHKS